MQRKRLNKKLNIEKINARFDSLGLSQSKLASELGVSRQIISAWMKNEKFPRPEKLLKLAKLLKLSFDDVVVKMASEKDPIIAFRKKARHKIPKDYIESAKYMGSLLEKLVPYLPFDRFSRPPSLIDPIRDYEYIHQVTKEIRKEICLTGASEITYNNLISFFNQFHEKSSMKARYANVTERRIEVQERPSNFPTRHS